MAGPAFAKDAVLTDLNGDGMDDLVSISDPPGTALGSLLIYLSTGTGFGAPTSQATGQNPEELQSADMNGDGNQDVVVINSFVGQVDLYLGNGAGALTLTASAPLAGGTITSLAIGDVNADGNLDAVVCDVASQSFFTLPGDGLGGFGTAIMTDVGAATGAGPTTLALGDFNADGNLDLAAGLANPGHVTTVWLGNSSGLFFFVATLANSNDTNGLAITDQDLDGFQDVIAIFSGADEVRLYLGDGTGVGFAPPVVHTNVHYPIDFDVTHLNADLRPDLVVAQNFSSDLSVMAGTASFARNSRVDATYAVDALPIATAVGDIDGDGKQDALTVSQDSGEGSYNFFMGVGNGLLRGSKTYDVGSSPVAAAIGHLNPGPDIDWVVANSFSNNVTVFFGNGVGGIRKKFNLPVAGAAPGDVDLKDFDLDGNLDLVLALSGTGGAPGTDISVALGLGNGNFSPAVSFGTGGVLPRTLAVADLNVDGRLDVLTANLFTTNISVLEGLPSSFGFQPAVQYQVTSSAFSPYSIAVGDLNGDADPDLAIGHNDSFISHLTVLYGTGGGLFDPVNAVATFPTVGSLPIGVAMGDLNNDGDLDLASANFVGGGNDVAVLIGNGLGGFAAPLTLTVDDAPFAIRMGDFDNDGNLDLATANTLPSHNLGIIRGDGTGGFATPEIYSSGYRTQNLAVGDLTSDGKTDAIGINYDSSTISVHRSQ